MSTFIDESGVHFSPDEKEETAPSPKETVSQNPSRKGIDQESICGKPVLPYSSNPERTPCICRLGHEGACVYEVEARDMDRVRDKLIARRANAQHWADRVDDTTCDHGRSAALGCASCDFERMRLEAEQDMAYEGRV